MKILYIASHLSTGGMPEVLLARVTSLQKTNVDVWVVEYSLYSDTYTAQRDKIKSILGNKFVSLGWFSDDIDVAYKKYLSLKELIEKECFDIIHFDDSIETYDSFNLIDSNLIEFIYNSPNKWWSVVETTHNSEFNANLYKKWIPNAFMHCSIYHYTDTFSKFKDDIPNVVIEYPIWERITDVECPTEFDKNKFNIINVGIWSGGKNQKEAVEMARYMDILYPNRYLFHFIGALAPNFKDYWNPIIGNLPDNVRIWDSQNEMERFYKWADLVLFNSTNELNPIVLKEAVSYKKPILMRNLSVYGNSYNEYASYLTGNIELDCLKLHSMITNPPQIKYNFSELKQMGVEMIKFYESINDIKKEDNRIYAPISFSAQFLDGAFVEITGDSDGTNYNVQFIDGSTNEIKHESVLPVYHWSRTSIKYYVDWKIKIIPENPKYREIEYKMDLSNKIVHISFESSSLGDTIAWMPYVEEFRKKHNCILYCSTFHNKLFINKYFNINFIQPGDTVFNSYAKYTLGWFYENNELDRSSHKSHFVNQPLQKTAADILGLEYKEIRPDINTFKYNGNLPDKYFTFSMQSTAQSKYWNYPNGWYELVDMLKSNGYIGVCVDQHTTFGIDGFMNKIPTNCIDKTGLSLEYTIGIIDGAEFHIGLSSGLSWLSWALDKKVVMISGFTDPILEFTQNCIRIHDDTVCNGCFTNPSYKFNQSDWLWCPVHKGTDRQFECSKVITPSNVFEQIKTNGII